MESFTQTGTTACAEMALRGVVQLQRTPVSSPVLGCFYRSSMCSPACPTSLASSLRCDEELSFVPAGSRGCYSVSFTCAEKIRIETGT